MIIPNTSFKKITRNREEFIERFLKFRYDKQKSVKKKVVKYKELKIIKTKL